MFFFIIGAILPLIFFFLQKKWPNRYLRYIKYVLVPDVSSLNLILTIRPENSVPLILGGTALIPPATAVNYVPWAIVAFIFQHVIRRRHFSWWAKYNCKPFHMP